MCQKVRNYEKTVIEICRNCKGSGVVYTEPDFHHYGKEEEPKACTCPICQGSGMVRKTQSIDITIESYRAAATK